MKNKYLKFLLISAVIGFTSCEQYTEDLNTDPNQFVDAPGELIIGHAQLGWSTIAGGNSARYAGVFTNQFTGVDRQYLSLEEYIVSANSFNSEWELAYVDGLAQAQIAYEKATEKGNNVLAGVALIVESGIMGEITALWGDVPYAQANNYEEYPFPEYDSQTDIYKSLQDKLSKAIQLVGDEGINVYGGTGNNRFGGNASWAKVAHSLKARYFLHVGDYTNAYEEAKKGISTDSESLVQLHEGTSANNANLFWQFMYWYRYGYMDASNSYLKNLLTEDNNVSRRLSTPGDSVRKDFYFSGNELNMYDGVFAADAPMPLISYEEVKLIEAESAYRLGDENSARKAFNELRESLSDKYNAEFPDTNASGNELLRDILEEKYITLIGQLQVFHDLRRTNNFIGVPAKTGSEIPQRFLYPQSEIDANPNTPSPIPGLFEETPINK